MLGLVMAWVSSLATDAAAHLEEIDFIYISFEFQVGIGFSGEPMTQCTHQSCENMNHVRT